MTTQGKLRNCLDCGAPITEGGVMQHDFGCDAAPNCQCDKTYYCESCKRLERRRGMPYSQKRLVIRSQRR
jgi:hypothetical protein